GRTVARVAQRGFLERGGDPALATERIVFVVGSPRSGTTFLAGAVGSQPGFVDLGEVRPVKASIRRWVSLPENEAATELRSTLAGEATRAAWAWRRYLTAARAAPEHTLEIRYEEIAADPAAAAERIASRLETDPAPLAEALRGVHSRSIGRWRRDLTPEQIGD